MSEPDGFADLRLNRQEGQVNESFWPSFTDIMTVVVMIFLIAMVVLLIRNMELVHELRSTVEAERAASELARATGAEKDTLAYQLHQAQSRVSEMQLEILRLEESEATQAQTIADQAGRIRDLAELGDRRRQQLATLEEDTARLTEELATANRQLALATQERALHEQVVADLRADLAGMATRLEQSTARAESLREDIDRRDTELETLRGEFASMEARYQTLTGEHDSLLVKYNRLIRPARSPKGRHLIEVRYWKEGNNYLISWREGDQGPYQPIDRRRLEAVLTRLKETHASGLYVKIIIPEKSGLSYNEAFQFTTDLHRRYDYYYRQRAAAGKKPTPTDRR